MTLLFQKIVDYKHLRNDIQYYILFQTGCQHSDKLGMVSIIIRVHLFIVHRYSNSFVPVGFK